MKTYISLLRGINVGGKNKILMKDLKDLYEKIGFTDVLSYIQSGNVIFKSKQTKHEVLKSIENGILAKFNLTISVIIETPDSLKQALENCEFLKNPLLDKSKIYFSFLNKSPNNLNVIEKSNYGDDKFANYKNFIYLFYPNGAGKCKLTNNVLEKKLKLIATSRNLKTLTKLINLSSL